MTLKKSEIIKEVKEAMGFQTDTDFAEFLGIKKTTLSSWYTRNTFDVELVFKKCKKFSAAWLLTGEGSKYGDQVLSRSTVNEPEEKYTSISKQNENERLKILLADKILEIDALTHRLKALMDNRNDNQ